MTLYDDYENENKQAGVISKEFRNILIPLVEKYKDYKIRELESILLSELTVTMAEIRLVSGLKRKKAIV